VRHEQRVSGGNDVRLWGCQLSIVFEFGREPGNRRQQACCRSSQLLCRPHEQPWRRAITGSEQRQQWGASTLLRHTLGRWVGRRGDPGVAAFLPHRDGRWREIGIGEGTDGDGDNFGKAGVLPVDRGAAYRAEAIREDIAALGLARPLGGLAGKGDLVPMVARLVADHGARATLAL